jgi:hypothetical protein
MASPVVCFSGEPPIDPVMAGMSDGSLFAVAARNQRLRRCHASFSP